MENMNYNPPPTPKSKWHIWSKGKFYKYLLTFDFWKFHIEIRQEVKV